MKNFVRTQFCKTPERVASAIEAFRLSLTPEKCQNYINKIHEGYILSIYRNNKKGLKTLYLIKLKVIEMAT